MKEIKMLFLSCKERFRSQIASNGHHLKYSFNFGVSLTSKAKVLRKTGIFYGTLIRPKILISKGKKFS